MSISVDLHLSNHINPSQAGQTAAQPENLCTTAIQDRTRPPLQSKTLASAVGKIWTAIKQPRETLAKHFKSRRRLQKLTLWRMNEPTGPLRTRKSSQEPSDTTNPMHSTVPAPALFEERPTRSLPGQDPPILATTATDSSISLSSWTDGMPRPTPAQDTGHSPSIIISFTEQQARSDSHPHTPLSEASTLQNSTFVNENFSQDFSEARLFPSLEADSIIVPDAIHATAAATSSQATQRPAPCLRTSSDHLNGPSLVDEVSHPAVLAMNSTPASVADFQGMGGHFEESRSPHHSCGG